MAPTPDLHEGAARNRYVNNVYSYALNLKIADDKLDIVVAELDGLGLPVREIGWA